MKFNLIFLVLIVFLCASVNGKKVQSVSDDASKLKVEIVDRTEPKLNNDRKLKPIEVDSGEKLAKEVEIPKQNNKLNKKSKNNRKAEQPLNKAKVDGQVREKVTKKSEKGQKLENFDEKKIKLNETKSKNVIEQSKIQKDKNDRKINSKNSKKLKNKKSSQEVNKTSKNKKKSIRNQE